jgi:glycerate kinase
MAQMRILVAPQEFKGSLTAKEAAAAIARGLRRALPAAPIDALPLADGGPGTVEALVDATGGSYREATCHDPLGRPIVARWGVLGDGATAAIEMAGASGLLLLSEAERDPRATSTFGTGELVRAALDAGHRRIIVGAGGSATNDGGAGLAQALGALLLDADGGDLPSGGAALASLARIDVSGLDARLADCDVTVATDVLNPLCGPDGASLLYGPQKGATAEVARALDAALAHYAAVIERDLGIDVRDVRGAGAAGGLGAGLIAFCHAQVRPGFEVVAEAVGLSQRIARADAVITGEGRLDRQTGFGKTPGGVARAARRAGKRVIAVVGSADPGAAAAFDAVYALTDVAASTADAIERADELLEGLAESAGHDLRG